MVWCEPIRVLQILKEVFFSREALNPVQIICDSSAFTQEI